MSFWVRYALVVVLGVCGLPGLAEPIEARDARKALFAPQGIELEFAPDLSDATRSFFTQVLDLSASQNNPAGYYGAVAFAPASGLTPEDLAAAMATGNEHLQASGNHHSVLAAEAAALAACEAGKSDDAGPCAVALRILPKRFEARALTLSQPATVDFRRRWRGGPKPKSLALSPGTGAWAIAKGDAAEANAVAACNAKISAPNPADCITRIFE